MPYHTGIQDLLWEGILLVFLKYVSGMELGRRMILYFIFAGIILGGFGVLVYTIKPGI